ncbi:hypothetical protein U2F26_20720 [Micromonospora sp. 4G57]|uniref:Tetratricopeptide repeat protein n=1 Tax=Micromonospora sicca TaxID=2202420 RepID=A0ABU5JDU4_9ACTN|nr:MULTISPECIES: hypothetical protein [unclassified Micromonospora]MDZ5445130.1 hypothetical protein [Micromonospora sp. 4G57]MDZ5490751.1 hypothetical protein [Micromonospora sp. 4G53]
MRGEFAGACEYYEQAIAVVTEVGANEDVVSMRSRQAQLYGHTSARWHMTCSATLPRISTRLANTASRPSGRRPRRGEPLIAQVLVGVADLALRRDQPDREARLLGASAGVRGLPDRSHPDVARIERAARSRLGDTGFAEAALEGTQTSWSQLIEVTLAS